MSLPPDPVLVLDSREEWSPCGVEECLKATGAALPLSFPAGPGDGDRIDFPKAMIQPDLPPVGYRRGPIAGVGLDWWQWWLFYPYNPRAYAGFGMHEGDWELVQLAYARGTVMPVLATGSQHRSGGKLEGWQLETRNDRPIFYVALGSHANYFEPSRELEDRIRDRADGEGQVLDLIEWREFGEWADWKGRWGNSTGEGRSPVSPARQPGGRWSAPWVYHASCRS